MKIPKISCKFYSLHLYIGWEKNRIAIETEKVIFMTFWEENFMKRRLFALVVIVLFAALLSGCATRGSLKARDAEISSLKQQVIDAQNQCKVLTDERDAAEGRAKELEGELNDLSDKLKIEMEKTENYTMLRVSEKLLFKSSQASLSNSGMSVLNDIADVLAKYAEYDVRIEGHTDNRKIKPEFYDKFKSNWELSTARATEVVRYLTSKKDVAPKRMIAVGYGEYRPIASNDDAAGRSQNRRVEFYIAPANPIVDLK
jgi:chemotaxis protein MotB